MIDCEKTAEQLFYEISELLIRCEILEKEASEYTPVVSVLDAARERKTILLNLHRYLEGDIGREECLYELDLHCDAMTAEELCIINVPDGPAFKALRGKGQLWLESAATIMWSLGELDRLPPFDSICYPFEIPVHKKDPSPRSIEELSMARCIATIWTTRALLWATLKGDSSVPPDHVPPLQLAAEMDGVIGLMEGDLAIMGTFPIHALSAGDCSLIAAISASRLDALNWLLAANSHYIPSWDDPSLNDYSKVRGLT